MGTVWKSCKRAGGGGRQVRFLDPALSLGLGNWPRTCVSAKHVCTFGPDQPGGWGLFLLSSYLVLTFHVNCRDEESQCLNLFPVITWSPKLEVRSKGQCARSTPSKYRVYTWVPPLYTPLFLCLILTLPAPPSGHVSIANKKPYPQCSHPQHCLDLGSESFCSFPPSLFPILLSPNPSILPIERNWYI